MSTQGKRSMVARLFQISAVLFLFLAIAPHPGFAQGPYGAVYVLTNQSPHNSVMTFLRAPDGSLTYSGTYRTEGRGTGTGADPLGSQGALVLDPSQRLLYAVNSGSNEVSVFAADGPNLQLLQKIASGGRMPVSIAVFGGVLYVLNAGGTPNITGFTINSVTNQLTALPGGTSWLAGGKAASPAQVAFSQDGSILMVAEKGTQTIDTYTVDTQGYASGPISHPSSGATPFGFAFIHGGIAVVSEAGPDALSSYQSQQDGALTLITGSLPNGQKATCWAVALNNSAYAYTTNAATATISSYTVAPDGTLSLLNATAGSTGTGSAPTDMALSADDGFLYVRDGGTDTVSAFSVGTDGSLTSIGSFGTLPAGAQGIAAR